MSVLSPAQIAQVAYFSGGWRGSDLQIAVAVALAESGGRTDATNKNTNGSVDYGLWQINSIHSQILQAGKWDDANSNAKMARAIYDDASSKWTPWVTYNTGAYRIYMGAAATAAASVNPGASFQTTDYATPAVETVSASSGGSGWGLLTNPHTYWRGVLIGFGFILVMIALYDAGIHTQVGAAAKSAAVSAAKKAAETGGEMAVVA